MHIKTRYGGAGTLKVTLQRDENDPYYNVIVKERCGKGPWKILKYYKKKKRAVAEGIFKQICEKF